MTRPKRIPYAEVAETVRLNPTRYAPLIVQRWGVPVTTAHRWAHEARRRGFITADDDAHHAHDAEAPAVQYKKGARNDKR